MQELIAAMVDSRRTHRGGSFGLGLSGALVACLVSAILLICTPCAWADAPASSASGDGDAAVSASAWQAKASTAEEKADLAAAISQEAYAQQSESGSSGHVGPYYAIEKRFVTEVENSFEAAAEEQYLVSTVSTGLAAVAVLAAVLAALALVKASRVRARATIMRGPRR